MPLINPSSISSRRGDKNGSRDIGLLSGSKYAGTKPTTNISDCFCLSSLDILAIWTSIAPEPWLYLPSNGWNPSQWRMYAKFLGSPVAFWITWGKVTAQDKQVTSFCPSFPSGEELISWTETTPPQLSHLAGNCHSSSGFQNHWSSEKRLPSHISLLHVKPQPSWFSCPSQWSFSNQCDSIFLQNQGSLAQRLILGPKPR